MRKWIAVLALVPMLTACSMFAAERESGYEQAPAPAPAKSAESAAAATVTGETTAAAADVLAAADAAFEKRDDRAQLELAIAGYEKALVTMPNEVKLYERLARATYFLADAHLRAEPGKQEEAYNKSIEWGERCMALDPDFKTKVAGGAKPDEAAKGLSKDYAGCIYWAAAALGKWATIKGFATRVANKDRIKNWVDTVTALDPNYFYGAPDRYWGAYYAILPGFMGKDLNKSEEHFKKSLAIAPNYFGTKVLMAERLATERSDRALYKALLEEVLNADPNVQPEIAPENKVEQVKAKELLAQIDEKVPE